MMLSITTSSPPPQLLILTWTTICHYCCRHVASVLPLTTHVANCPYTGQVVNTWPSIVNSSKVVLSTRGKLSKSVLRIQMIKSHMFGKFRQVHIQDSTVWEHGRVSTVVTTRSCSQQCWLLQLFWRLIWISDFSVTTFPEWLDTKSPNLPQLDVLYIHIV